MKKAFYSLIVFLGLHTISYAQQANKVVSGKTNPTSIEENLQAQVNLNSRQATRRVQPKLNTVKNKGQQQAYSEAICTKNQAKMDQIKRADLEQYKALLKGVEKMATLEKDLAMTRQSNPQKAATILAELNALKAHYNLK